MLFFFFSRFRRHKRQIIRVINLCREASDGDNTSQHDCSLCKKPYVAGTAIVVMYLKKKKSSIVIIILRTQHLLPIYLSRRPHARLNNNYLLFIVAVWYTVTKSDDNRSSTGNRRTTDAYCGTACCVSENRCF